MSAIAGTARGPMRKVTSFVAILSILLSGCVQSLQDEGVDLSPAERDLRQRTEAQRTAQSAMTGAVVGTIFGAVLGAALGARSGNAGTGALLGGAIGAGAGALAGAAYGEYVNARARTFANEEMRANALIDAADKDIAHYNQINATARTIIAEQELKISRLNDQYRQKQITREKFEKEMSSSNNNERILKDQCKAIDDQITEMQKEPASAGMTQKISQLERQRDELKASYAKLLQLLGTVPAEIRTSS